MTKKLVHDVAQLAAKLHAAGLTFEDAQLAAEYCLIDNLDYLDLSLGLEETPANVLWRGFTWDQTPEGHNYWCDRANLLSGMGYEH